jgi:hypothetical protein
MMWDLLFWVYAVNATLIIIHEMDSAYQKEWELFRLPGGATLFLALHVPIVLLLLWGAVLVYMERPAGLVLSFVLAAGGIFACAIHTVFIKKGHPAFRAPISQVILWGGALVSVVQAVISVMLVLK